MNRNDLIRRGDVMDKLEELVWNGEISATVALKVAGLAAVEEAKMRPRGCWETALDDSHWCSNCGHDATFDFDGVEVLGICCTYCGALMDLECADG